MGIEDKFVCSSCVKDRFLQDIIRDRATNENLCSYCNRGTSCIGTSELAEIFNRAFWGAYTLKLRWLTAEPHEKPYREDIQKIVLREVKPESISIAEDLCKILLTQWDSQNNSLFSLDDFSIEHTGASDQWLSNRWSDMHRSIKNEFRFLNPDAQVVLKLVFDDILQFVTKNGESLITEISTGHQLQTLYRARVFQSDEALRSALEDPESTLGPPPAHAASAGRMNAKGISVFYAANHPDVAMAEVRPPVGAKVAIAEFKILRPLRLLDLTKFQDLHVIENPDSLHNRNYSIFDEAVITKEQLKKFISKLEAELVKPVMPDHSEDGYLVTQVIADYLAAHKELNLDGVIFKSIQISKSVDYKPLNVVLFNKAAVIKHDLKIGRKLKATTNSGFAFLNRKFKPEILYTKDESELGDNFLSLDELNYSLELDPRSIVICDVESVQYTKISTPVVFREDDN